jgi:hypothetical protein
MHTHASSSAPSPTPLDRAKAIALQRLLDIVTNSECDREARLAAAAILRIPDPDPHAEPAAAPSEPSGPPTKSIRVLAAERTQLPRIDHKLFSTLIPTGPAPAAALMAMAGSAPPPPPGKPPPPAARPAVLASG